jgi:hypothetical protein
MIPASEYNGSVLVGMLMVISPAAVPPTFSPVPPTMISSMGAAGGGLPN